MRYIYAFIFCLLLSSCAMKSPFEAKLTGDGKYWVLTKDLEYLNPETGYKVNVPRGFVTDLASVPRVFWSAFPPCGKYTPSAVVHDYLYWVQLPECQRECADNILLIAMKEACVNKVTYDSIYTAVRLGGQQSWDDNKKLKSSNVKRFVPEEYMEFSPYETWGDIERKIQKQN